MRLPRKLGVLGLASVLAVAAGLGALAHGTGPAQAQQGNPAMSGCPHAGMGYGMMGRGMMGPGMMGPGMMGQGPMGPGMMGQGMWPGMMGQGSMGPGMMGQGMGPGMMGQGPMGPGMMGQGPMGPGMMGPGMGQGYGPGPMGPGMGMGPGMMGQGMGPGSMMQVLPQDLTTEQVRHMFEHRLGMMGNPNLKLGDVTEADEDTITAEIVTQDGSLVQRFAVDRHTGMFRPAQ